VARTSPTAALHSQHAGEDRARVLAGARAPLVPVAEEVPIAGAGAA